MAALQPPGPSNEQDPPEVEGLAMAGLVAVLRQLGDLAELAAEVLDGLQDQVMAVSARGRRLALRAKRLQAAHLTPSIHTKPNHRLHWHPSPRLSQHQPHGVGEAPPRSIVDHIKRCRGPPSLSALDRFDVHGDGACLKRYTDPSFFRTAHSAKPHSDGCRSQTDASEKQSLGFLSMLRQLKRRQTPGSVSPSLQSRIPKHYESSPEQPHMEMDKAKENHRGQSKDSPTFNCCSDYVGNCCSDELQRTSSFEAWLSPGAGARFSTHDACETNEESSSQLACSRFVSHAATSNAALTTDDAVHAKQDSAAAETSCNKGVSIEMVASSSVNSCSQDTKVDTPPPVPIPPMRWLPVKVHTGPVTCRKPFGRNRVSRAGGKILRTRESSEPATHSYEEQQLARADSDKDMHAPDMPAEELTEAHQVFHRKGPEISSRRGSTVSYSEANKHAASGVGGEGSLHRENVFVSAVEQLARMSPPWVPRPKHPVPEVASCGRITVDASSSSSFFHFLASGTMKRGAGEHEPHKKEAWCLQLRNGPSPIHRSRSILDSRTALVDETEDKVNGC